jgi:hypothetical protein
MRDFFLGLLSGLLLAGATGWYWFVGRKAEPVRRAQTKMATGLEHVVDKVEAKLDAFQLRGTDIKEDLARTGQVVRRNVRAFGTNVADATADTRITATVKAKLIADHDLSAWHIAVSTTEGRVTLSGTVQTHDQIGKATLLALDTAGVREVMSTLKVKQ